MYETHPKFCLALVAVPLIAGCTLPAVLIFPNVVAETAAGLHIAIMLFVMWIIRLILVPDPYSWLDAVRAPLMIMTAVTALGFSPQDSAMDVALAAGFVGLLVGAGTGLALIFGSRRPTKLGFSIGRDIWIVVAGMSKFILFNHSFRFANAQGTALVSDLVILTAFAQWVPFGQVRSQGSRTIQGLNILSLTLSFGAFGWMVRNLDRNIFDPIEIVIALFISFVVVGLFYPSLERMVAE